MKVLVLGGTGAMGEPLVKLLNDRGDIVHVTTRRNLESKDNIHYINGDAHNESFIKELMKNHYDVIVDFMVYDSKGFKKRANLYLDSTDQYIFLSSARVYADSKRPLTEDSPRLLDVCRDKVYLKTDEYALAKARAEDILFNSDKNNWTIIRPYITYNTKRLQLGGLELSSWTGRIKRYIDGDQDLAAYKDFYLVLPKDIANKTTTLTYGDDVARAIVSLIGNTLAMGEAFHITGNDHMKWIDVANIYISTIHEITGIKPKLYMPENSYNLSIFMGNQYQIKYDRIYDRIFDNSKINKICNGNIEKAGTHKCNIMDFCGIEQGLKKCLSEYLTLKGVSKMPFIYGYEAYVDKYIYKCRSLKLNDFKEKKDILGYMLYYYAPDAVPVKKSIKAIKRIKNRMFNALSG